MQVVLIGYAILFNILVILAQGFLNREHPVLTLHSLPNWACNFSQLRLCTSYTFLCLGLHAALDKQQAVLPEADEGDPAAATLAIRLPLSLHLRLSPCSSPVCNLTMPLPPWLAVAQRTRKRAVQSQSS